MIRTEVVFPQYFPLHFPVKRFLIQYFLNLLDHICCSSSNQIKFIVRQIKDFFVKSLHKMEAPLVPLL